VARGGQWGEAARCGAKLLDDVVAAIRLYVILPANSAETLALWATHTHCFDCFVHSPRAAITSPEKRCGKTTALDVLGKLVARPLSTANATASVIFRIIELAAPTLLIDEADTFLKDNEDLRGILNSGHRKGGQSLRVVGDNHEPRQFSTWAPLAIAIIGRLPGTLEDRSVVIPMRRRKPTEKVKLFRSDRAGDLEVLARKMARWAKDHERQLATSDPNVGDLLNRIADNWRPLFAIADAAGGHWPKRVREIADAADRASGDQSLSILLLQDIHWVFDGRPEVENDRVVLRGTKTDRISSDELVSQLVAIADRPWGEWGRSGKPITQNRLARLLDKFGIEPSGIRIGSQTPRGYYRSAFEDAFSSYLPNETAKPNETATLQQPNNDGHFCDFQSATPKENVAVEKAHKPNNDGHCCTVAVGFDFSGDRGGEEGAPDEWEGEA
jgi:hypothetical protein